MKKLKLFAFSLIAFLGFGFTNVDALTIAGNSVYRDKATTAAINFISDGSGTAYYKITNSDVKPTPTDFMTAIDGGSVTANTTKNISLTELTSGSKYVHIIVKNDDNLSNVLTISMPYDFYYFDNFEAKNSLYPNWYSIKYNGSGNAAQKIIATTDKSGSQTNVFRLKGSSGWASDSRLDLSGEISNFAIMEIDIKFVSNDAGSIILGQKEGSGSVRAVARLIATGGKFRLATGDSDGEDTGVSYSLGTWYKLKIVLDYTNRKFDAYVDNVKINNEPVDAHPSYTLNYLGIASGNGSGGNEIYSDNVKFYTTSSLNYSVTFETNGGSQIANQTIKTGENALKPSDPIKDNFSFVGWYSDLSLTTSFDFDTPITKPTTLYAKWREQKTITFNAVTGVTFDKNSPLIVDSGSNAEITITANLGYRLTSVKVNNVEKLSTLENNKLTLNNITENQEVKVTVEKIEYEVTDGAGQKYTIGKNEDAVFKVGADKDLFLKVYLDDEELNSEFYTITEGSTIITLKQEFLNNLLPGIHSLKATFSDGGEATATFVIAQPTENNPKTNDGIMLSIIIGLFSLIGLLGAGLYHKKMHKEKFKKLGN